MKIYLAEYCYCIYEADFVTLSVHKSRPGAAKALKQEVLKRERELLDDPFRKGLKLSDFESNRIRVLELED